jgi:mannobiose 2-epimerase
MVWLAAAGGEKVIAEKGGKELWEKFWDQDYGGFCWQTSVEGGITDSEKHMYGNAFAVFALAKAEQTWDANWAFQWMDLHAHDEEHGGYIETCWSDGEQNLSSEGTDALGTPYGLKSMNTHLHILEALIELYNLSGDSKVRTRLLEVFELFRTKFVTGDGKLFYYMTRDYKQASSVDSYGHALETAFLMIEAAYYTDVAVDETWTLAKAIVNRCLEIAWDKEFGGFFYEGTFEDGPRDLKKIWWAQAEGLNALRLMAAQYGAHYQDYYDQLWRFVDLHQIDREHGGWLSSVQRDGTKIEGLPKSDAWTEGYHQGRAVLLATSMS